MHISSNVPGRQIIARSDTPIFATSPYFIREFDPDSDRHFTATLGQLF